MIVPSGQGARMVATENFILFQLAEERSTSVATILLGKTIPLSNAEFQLYKTYKIALARLEQQQEKGI